ncbi:hypothetical protein M422DRAFT_270715 [Sphaerobolus stellatus SS14]|uniref:Uncharacterized protein n=1 Tax=Sphaerobolus stellatus (strain SS14) TaxID=990650 RepID=A0A0C9URP4_SPHS4|nr:hypothetical protein M422DRAFT_270715 [Sphaerobolus stellatus SS14]
MSAFKKYSTPRASERFSEEFFAALTFREAKSLTLPQILNSKAVNRAVWTNGSGLQLETSIQEGEVIPSFLSLHALFSEMELQYHKGMRGVEIELETPHGPKVISAHLSKLQLYKSINNHTIHVLYANALENQIAQYKLLDVATVHHFLDKRICSTIEGFSTTDSMQLWMLGSLVREHWLYEDVINAALEILYWRTISKDPFRQARYLNLPTHVWQEAVLLYDQPGRPYSPNLLDLRQRIAALGSCLQAITLTYRQTEEIAFRDSLGHDLDASVIPIVNWLFEGLQLPFVKTSVVDEGPLQPMGSGSYGIVCINTMERMINLSCSGWTPQKSFEM